MAKGLRMAEALFGGPDHEPKPVLTKLFLLLGGFLRGLLCGLLCRHLAS
jgi:hypothetical protein